MATNTVTKYNKLFIESETNSKFIVDWLDRNGCRRLMINGIICYWRDIKGYSSPDGYNFIIEFEQVIDY